MYEQIRRFIHILIHEIKQEFGFKDDLWTRLCEAREFELIDKLRKIEIEAKRYPHHTVIIPKNGFIDDEDLNNIIVKWLYDKKVNVWSPSIEITELETALRTS
jgi:hypothetical protein